MNSPRSRLVWNLLFAFMIVYGIVSLLHPGRRPGRTARPAVKKTEPVRPVVPPPAELGAEERNTIEIFEKMSPAVVSIVNAAYRRDFFTLNVYEVPRGSGSGIVWDERGHIVTNFHVIYQADRLEISLTGRRFYEATIVGVAPDYDLAVLKIDIDAEDLCTIPLGASKKLRVGQKVLALGNPFGLDRSLSTGIISALGRTIQSLTGHKIHDVIQTDAAINPGNSGGPLLDSFGRLIGINTAILSPSGASSGIGFAIPVDTLAHLVPQLIQKGRLSKAGLGITLIPDRLRESWGIEGAAVWEVVPGSSADRAGLKGTRRMLYGKIRIGDVIFEVDGRPVRNNDDLTALFETRYRVGDTVTIRFRRGEKVLEAAVPLQEIGTL
jgi:S1-C subfamily serine protease